MKSQNTILLDNIILDSIPDLIFFKDQKGVYQRCNIAFANFVGRPP
jgi:PAS domain-containing protein